MLALVEIYWAKLSTISTAPRMSIRDVKNPVGMALTVLGIQQSTARGWGDVRTLASIIVGVLILVGFVIAERNTEDPLIDVRAMAANRPFAETLTGPYREVRSGRESAQRGYE
jgi:DHA2 family multidrug resistance protein-like MFS transporter